MDGWTAHSSVQFSLALAHSVRQAGSRHNMHAALCRHYDVIRLHDVISHDHPTAHRQFPICSQQKSNPQFF